MRCKASLALLLSVAVIVGLVRGVTILLNNGMVNNTILFYASNLVQHFTAAVFILLILAFCILFAIPVSSLFGMAALTIPIIGFLAILLNMPCGEIVNTYLFDISIMCLITHKGSILPALTMVNVSYKAWLKFIMPLVLMLLVVNAVFLVVGIYL
jgi:uncharacterized ion transporter superfamily protein YfcC